jgi:hypothetical protein
MTQCLVGVRMKKERTMKFLTINKIKDSLALLPPAVSLQIFEMSLAAIKQQKKEGKILEMYYSPGENLIIGIHEYDDADQWAKDQIKIPVMMYADIKAYPLADFDKYIKNNLASVKVAARMASSAPK